MKTTPTTACTLLLLAELSLPCTAWASGNHSGGGHAHDAPAIGKPGHFDAGMKDFVAVGAKKVSPVAAGGSR